MRPSMQNKMNCERPCVVSSKRGLPNRGSADSWRRRPTSTSLLALLEPLSGVSTPRGQPHRVSSTAPVVTGAAPDRCRAPSLSPRPDARTGSGSSRAGPSRRHGNCGAPGRRPTADRSGSCTYVTPWLHTTWPASSPYGNRSASQRKPANDTRHSGLHQSVLRRDFPQLTPHTEARFR